MDQTVVTVGFAGVVAVCVGGGIAVVIWLYSQFSSIKDELLTAIAKSREDGDAKTDEVSDKIEVIGNRLQAHELSVEQRFVTKDSMNAGLARVEKAIEDVRADLRDLLRYVTKMGPGDAPRGP